MNNITVIFYILLGVYLLGLFIFTMVKRIQNKKKVKSKVENYERERETPVNKD